MDKDKLLWLTYIPLALMSLSSVGRNLQAGEDPVIIFGSTIVWLIILYYILKMVQKWLLKRDAKKVQIKRLEKDQSDEFNFFLIFKKRIGWVAIIVLGIMIIGAFWGYFSSHWTGLIESEQKNATLVSVHVLNEQIIEWQLLSKINQERNTSNNTILTPLVINWRLQELAKNISRKMLIEPLNNTNTKIELLEPLYESLYFQGGAYNLDELPLFTQNEPCGIVDTEQKAAECIFKKWNTTVEFHANMLRHRSTTGIGVSCNVTICKVSYVVS